MGEIAARRWRTVTIAVLLASAMVSACSASGQAGGQRSASGAISSRPAQSRPASSPATAASPSPSPVAGKLGRYWVGKRWLRLTEPAHSGPTGAAIQDRTLVTEVFYPLAGPPSATSTPARGPRPLVVFAPGFQQCGGPYADMLRSWASAGYVVTVVNFPNSDCRAGSAATESDMVNQPADLSYVISRMLALSAARTGPFSGLIDPSEVAAAGQSDGGDTVAAIAANTCCRDRRVRAVAVLSGAPWPPMPGRYFTTRPVPMLFVQGSADTINYPGCSAQLYLADPAWARYYLDLFGASHTGPYWGTNTDERVVVKVTVAFFNRFALHREGAGPVMTRAGNVAGVSALYGHGGGAVRSGPCDN